MENMATLANISNFIHRNCMGLNFCKEKLGRKNCQTLFQKSTDKENTHTHTHTHTHSQENPGISGISPKLIQRYMSQKYLIISDNLRVC